MQETKRNGFSRLSDKSQIIVLLFALAGLLLAIFVIYGFLSFLGDLKQGNPIPLVLIVSVVGLGFVLLSKLGLDFAYKEE